MLKIKHIRSFCSAGTYAAGLEICKPGKVRKLRVDHIDADTVKANALVLGNFGYYHNARLVLDARRNNLLDDYRCDCYEQTQLKHPCRHCIALALALAADGENPLGAALECKQEEPEAPVQPVVEPMAADPVETPEAFAAGEQPAAPEIIDIPSAPVVELPPVPLGDPKGMEILFGHIPGQDYDPLVWYPNDTAKVFHTNTGIIGTMGTGKTQFTKSLIAQLYRKQENNFHGTPLGILIFDYKGDYNLSKQDFMQAVNARVLSVVKLPFNPLTLVRSRNFKPMLPVHTANAFVDTIARAYRLGVKQRNALYTCIDRAYQNAGIVAADPQTWDKLAPTFDMVFDIYENDREIPKNDSLEAAMQDLHRFCVFESNPYHTTSLFDLLKGVVVIDLSGYDERLQSLIVGITLDQFYAQMHSCGSSATDGSLRELTRMILVDEADNFLRKDFPALKKIMKEGREFGVGTILSTQALDHFATGEDDYSRYIMTWVVHNVSDLKRSDVEYVFRTRSGSAETESLYGEIKSCERFHSIIKIGNASPIHVRDKAFFELMRDGEAPPESAPAPAAPLILAAEPVAEVAVPTLEPSPEGADLEATPMDIAEFTRLVESMNQQLKDEGYGIPASDDVPDTADAPNTGTTPDNGDTPDFGAGIVD